MLNASLVILSGGKNTRMQSNKAFLKIKDKTLIEIIIDSLSDLFSEIIVVTNEPELYQSLRVKIIKDLIPHMGPLSGIHAGLKYSNNDINLVVACDMPFADKGLAEYMVNNIGEADVYIPCIKAYLQPLFAVYKKKCLSAIEDCLNNNQFKVISFYPDVRVAYLGEEKINELSSYQDPFFNVNTPKEFQKLNNYF